MDQDELIAKSMRAYRELLDLGLGKDNHEPCISLASIDKAIRSGSLFDITYLSWSGCVNLSKALKLIDDYSRVELSDSDVIKFHTQIRTLLSSTLVNLKLSRISAREAAAEAAHLACFEKLHFLPLFQRRGLVSFVRAVEEFSNPQIAPFKAAIFGSYSTGRAERWSDVDLAVVSKRFGGISWQRRIDILRELLPNDGSVINPVGVTPVEYQEKMYPSILRAIRQGKMVYH